MTVPYRTLSRLRPLAGVAAVALATVVAACSDSSTTQPRFATPGATSAVIAPTPTTALKTFLTQGLLRTTPLPEDIVVTRVISNAGGTIAVPGADFVLQIPRGAFTDKSMTFTVRALAGSAVAYDFEPHGVVFLAPLKFVQLLSRTTARAVTTAAANAPPMEGAYFPARSMVNPTTGVAAVSEIQSAVTDWTANQVSFPIWHFSGYMISTGRE